MVAKGHNVGVAFALCFAAGFATVLGGCIVFSKRLVHLANPVSLAVALSISAGVMMFISLVEIFNESVHLFHLGLKTDSMSEQTATGHAWLAATACFLAGIILIYIIDAVVHKISPVTHDALEVDQLGNLCEDMDQHEHEVEGTTKKVEKITPVEETDDKLKSTIGPAVVEVCMMDAAAKKKAQDDAQKIADRTKHDLQRMGLLSALALGLHNLPEGIATYTGAMQNSSVGFSLAVGIGLHNIPEGIAVAAPIFFATGSRWKGIMWCFISAIAEPFGGFLAWVAVGNGMDPVPEGILFGIVCGIMVCICVKELWPTAYKFAGKKTHYVTIGSFIGMFIMITSLILFEYAGV